MHQRQQIREAVKAALVAGDTAAQDRVYETRVVPWSRVQIPAIAVYTLSETVADESRSTTGRELTRVMQLEIIGAVRASENVDDALDALSLEIERVMHADETFGDVCGDSILTTTEIAVEAVGDKPIGFISMIYEVTYYTHAPEPADLALDDLSTVAVEYSLSGQQTPADDAHDTLENLEA